MKTLLILLPSIFYANLLAAQIDWSGTKEWKLYKVSDSVLFRTPPDSLGNVKAYLLNRDSIMIFFSDAKRLPQGTKAAWMGGFLATFKYEGEIRKLFVSSYGAFVFEPKSKIYYQLSLDIRDNWFAYINSCASTLTY